MLARYSKIFRNIRYMSTLAEQCSDVKKVPHVPVMAEEVLHYLKPKKGELIIDMTFGAGGHSRKLLECSPDIKLIALDRDPVAYGYADSLAEEFPGQVIPLLGRFSELPKLLQAKDILPSTVDCILFDFGCSSMQFDDGNRGFALSQNGPLDMRMDGCRFPDSPTAADVLARATEEDLYKIIKTYGEEKQARKIARVIVESRYMFKTLATTEDLSDLVKSICIEDYRLDKLQRPSHVATKTFQAIRIFVNNELNEMNYALLLAHSYLKVGGRIVTITFHSLEDTIAKRHLSGNMLGNTVNPLPLKYSSHSANLTEGLVKQIMEPQWKMLHQHVITPKYEEVENNPRSRSAKLRAAVKIR
uniref:Probable methyltransferase-like protein 15 homolog n=1 Tax=Diabrotica virgifera virgifera TaxID=50390 RepID=A0A6P7G1D4_DIAVI